MPTQPTRSTTPDTLANQIADQALDAFRRASANIPDAQAIVMVLLPSEKEANSGIGMAGFENDGDAIVYLFGALNAILKANGKSLQVIPL